MKKDGFVGVRMTETQKQQLTLLAKQEGRSLSQQILFLVEKGITLGNYVLPTADPDMAR